jgi:hypothetical protein
MCDGPRQFVKRPDRVNCVLVGIIPADGKGPDATRMGGLFRGHKVDAPRPMIHFIPDPAGKKTSWSVRRTNARDGRR